MTRSLICVALILGARDGLSGQAPPPNTDAAVVIPGAHYRAGPLKRSLFGAGYRDLWTLPIRVPVLDLGAYAGGLTPLERGGGNRTVSLRMRGAEGREYVFRSVDKDVTRGMPADLRNTWVHSVLQDQTSAKHPAGALVVAPLLEAVGALHATPTLYVMPDHPGLGPFRAEFAGRFGLLEERLIDADDGGPPFAGADKVIGTERLLERLEEDPDHRVDARDYLTVRLLDLLVGDEDRHADQYRWARFDEGQRHRYRPIPRDRDNALVRHGGLLLDVARLVTTPKWTHFDGDLTHVKALTLASRELDRRFLAELPKPVWDSTVAFVQARLSDEVIARAVGMLPPEIHAYEGRALARALRSRRDQLPRAARGFYRQVARVVEVRGTDKAERLDVEHHADRSVEVRLTRKRKPDEPHFRRVFQPDDTDEVRILLRGGDDHAVVRGDAGPIAVHVVGGGGDDVLVDSVRAPAGRQVTFFYDDRGNNRFATGARTHVDRHPYPTGAATELSGVQQPVTTRDQGQNHSISPHVDYSGNLGVIIGAETRWTRYGYRYAPYASRLGMRGEYAIGAGFAVEANGEFHRRNRPTYLTVSARASQIERVRFHGFGNQTPDAPEGDKQRFIVSQDQLAADVLVHRAFGAGERLDLAIGPSLSLTRPDPVSGSPFAALGRGSVGQVGARALLELERRDNPAFPRRGVYTAVNAAVFPAVWGDAEVFGRLGAEGRAYLPLGRAAYGPTLALRAGGERVWGNFPVHEAAFIGGGSTLRGYSRDRFAGDASLYGSAELRVKLFEAKLITRGRLGVLGLADAGRVWYRGESPGGFHPALGGGLWFATLERPYLASAILAQGEAGGNPRLYLRLEMPF